MSYVGQHVIIDIRSEVFRKLQRLSMSFYDKNKTGTIMSYVTNDVNALQGAMVDNTIELVTESIILVGSVCAMIYLDWKLTLFTILTFPVVLYFMNFFGKKNPQLRWDDPGSCGRYHFCFAGIGFFCQGGQVFCTGTV
jgi:subfamily B ATP-binding cassette protein MsbA